MTKLLWNLYPSIPLVSAFQFSFLWFRTFCLCQTESVVPSVSLLVWQTGNRNCVAPLSCLLKHVWDSASWEVAPDLQSNPCSLGSYYGLRTFQNKEQLSCVCEDCLLEGLQTTCGNSFVSGNLLTLQHESVDILESVGRNWGSFRPHTHLRN